MLYRYRIKPLSPFMTPLMSDTFFGHFCWAVLYEKGEDFLADFLSTYRNDKKAPVLFSSAFISGHLPRPVLPPLKRQQSCNFIEKYFVENADGPFKYKVEKEKRFRGMSIVKSWKKQRIISLENWLTLKNNYSEFRLFEIFYDQLKAGIYKEARLCETEVTASNTISRVSGKVMEEGGGLFQREKTWYHKNTELELYVEINSKELLSLVNWFLTDYLPLNGFGKDKSVGMGYLEISTDVAFNPDIFNVSTANARMVLSSTAFEAMGKYNSFYRLMTKFGKLGGEYAVSSPTGGATRPFKKPILMLEPGSIFFTTEHLNNKPLLDHVHSDERIRQCGVPVTLPIKIMEDDSNVTA